MTQAKSVCVCVSYLLQFLEELALFVGELGGDLYLEHDDVVAVLVLVGRQLGNAEPGDPYLVSVLRAGLHAHVALARECAHVDGVPEHGLRDADVGVSDDVESLAPEVRVGLDGDLDDEVTGVGSDFGHAALALHAQVLARGYALGDVDRLGDVGAAHALAPTCRAYKYCLREVQGFLMDMPAPLQRLHVIWMTMGPWR